MQTPFPDLDNAVLLSALEHYGYCPRQCALIHREQTYDENIFTLQGNAVHERVDQPGTATSDGVRSEYSVPLWSASLGVVGKADLIEFRGDTPYPVEYKHGPSRENNPADLQLCGQAMCLEEMLDVDVPEGAVYHFSSRRRREVAFTPELRLSAEQAITEVRRILASDTLPTAPADARCMNCSLIESCLPFVVSDRDRNRDYQRLLFTPARVEG
jgi:CRISPR-associated exonuclease Cas4